MYRKHCYHLLQTNVAYPGSISSPAETPKPEEHLLKEAMEEVIARKNGYYEPTTTPWPYMTDWIVSYKASRKQISVLNFKGLFTRSLNVADCERHRWSFWRWLLDKWGCAVIDLADIQIVFHLMLKVSLKRSTRDHIWSQKWGVSGAKHFYWFPLCGITSFHVSFYHFS